MNSRTKSGSDDRFDRLAPAAGVSTRAVRQHVDILFDPLVQPLSDEQRSLAFAAFSNLLGNFAADIHACAEGALTHLDTDAAIARAESHPGLRRPDLASALLHRSEEHRLAARLKTAGVSASLGDLNDKSPSIGYLSQLADSEDEETRQRTLTFSQLQSARLDGLGQPIVLADELLVQTRSDCAWALAASLADGQNLSVQQTISTAVRSLLAGYDHLRSAQYRAVQLAARLQERGDIDSRMLLRLADEGEALLLVACSAVKAGVSSGTAWGLLMRAEPAATIAFLTGMGLGSGGVAQIGARLFAARRQDFAKEELLQEAIALTSDTDAELAASLLAYWRLDPAFRAALEARPAE